MPREADDTARPTFESVGTEEATTGALPGQPSDSLAAAWGDVTGALHDVSNALTVMLGWVSEARAAGTREAVDYALKIIEHRAKAARDIARRAIGASSPFEDREDLLETAIAEAVESLAVEAQRRGVRLHRTDDGREARGVRVPHPGDVSQIVTNLLMNAIAHAPSGTRVDVHVEVSDARVAIDVTDEGPGVPASRSASIFEGDSTREGGAGVGLRHARAVARAAGGDLLLMVPAAKGDKAAHAGAGARAPHAPPAPPLTTLGAHFRVTWPRADVMPPPPVSVPRLKLFEGTRILVVEDDAHVTQLLEAALTARGATVTVARDAQELVRVLHGPPHDAVLLDLSPIAHDVESAFASLQASSPDATVVVISGSAEALPSSLATASVRFVRKPFEVGEIVTALAAGTAGSRARPPSSRPGHS